MCSSDLFPSHDKDANNDAYKGSYQIVPILGYYDVFKNYYANKQEERFYIMGGSSIQNATTIVSEDFTGTINNYANDTLVCTAKSRVTITGTDLKLEDIKQIKFTIDTTPIYIHKQRRPVVGKSNCTKKQDSTQVKSRILLPSNTSNTRRCRTKHDP